MWETPYMPEEGTTPLQEAVARAISASGKTVGYFDARIQERTQKTGKPVYDLMRGNSKRPHPDTLRLMEEVLDLDPGKLSRIVYQTMQPPRSSDQAPVRVADAGEAANIISLDLSLSMGAGTTIEDFVEEHPVALDIALLRSITRTPIEKLRMVRGIGDSMEPKFFTNDRILVDISDRTLSRMDGYYWITLWGSHGLKGLRPIGPGRVRVISDNPRWDAIDVDADELTIEGRAIWFARDL